MDEEEIDVVNYEPDLEKSIDNEAKPGFSCEECEYVGRTLRGLNAHRRHKHEQKPEEPARRVRQNAKKRKETVEEKPERVTTKQLLGGRKRPKTVLENVEEGSSSRGPPIQGLEMIDQDMPVGEFVARRTTGAFNFDGEYDDMGGPMVVGEEIVIDGEGGEEIEEIPINSRYVQKKYIRNRSSPKPRRPPNRFPEKDGLGNPFVHQNPKHYSNRLVHGDPDGKYKCYIQDCGWKGAYRSLRMEHMKTIHPDWKMPPRYLLQRITKDNTYINPEDYVPPIACQVEGCTWRGNFRASRSAHMKKEHPQEHAEKKKKLPGYDCNGSYTCHFPTCPWRGWSRSTRSLHLKKEHPEWRPEDSRLQMLLTCFHCKSSYPSYQHLTNHIEQHGGIGLHVDQIFDSKEDFSSWLERIEGIYSMTFEKSESLATSTDFIAYTLHCNCVGGRGIQIAADSRNFIYQNHHFLKRRTHHFLTRSKNDCSAHLEVREDPYRDQITVKGSLEHTGHRFGTPLVRMSPMDRQLYADILEIKNHREFRLRGVDAVEKLNTFEGFTMDNFMPPKTIVVIEPLDDDPIISLRMIIDQSDQSCFFAVDFGEFGDNLGIEKCSFGYMSHEMKRYWTEFGPDRVVTIDVCIAEFDTLDLFQYSVIVSDEQFVPKCALIYLTTDQSTGCQTVLEQLRAVDPRPPVNFMCDASQIWPDTIEKLYRTETEPEPPALISEWTIMDYWATKAEQLVDNEFDIYCIITALRRLLRTEDANQFMFFVVEFFEALFECGYDRFAEFFDAQLADLEYLKRWSPCHRNAFTSHGHPTLAVASQSLRSMYLSARAIERPDQWFAHSTKRIDEFNDVRGTQTFTLRPIDTPKKFYYETINIQEFHKQVVEQDAETLLVYEEEVDEGEYVEVVEEEVIGEEELYEEVLDPGQTMEHLGPEEVVEIDQMEHLDHLEQGEIHQEDQEHPEHHEDPEDLDIQNHPEEEDQNQPSTSEEVSEPRKRSPSQSPPQSPSSPIQKQRDTTRAVIRGTRKRKERFAELRDCPPDVMRAIAAHAISYDGRKKEQRPFICLPSEAQLGQSATPVIPTPDLRPYLGDAMPTNPKEYQGGNRRQSTSEYRHESPRKFQPVSQEWRQKMHHHHQQEHHRRLHEMDQQPSTSGPSTSYHHHGMMEMEDDDVEDHHQMHHDDQQPCSSSSMYR